ncbi:MAG: MerR family transcriptional regulator [Flavobacteriales bacterium]|nr:MerR family transcriptional regulator [Flavobacteriales bacterium]
MSYTVKMLAKISGISKRTLHWYDEIGLLKPAHYGTNGYRYYEEEQLLLLQQILFFRKLGFNLNNIQSIVNSNDFDKARALSAHKQTLEETVNRTQKLIHTIDKTILHLKGEQAMQDKEFYDGFDLEKQKEYEQFLAKYYGTVAEDLILESKKRTINWHKHDWEDVKREGNNIYKALEVCIEKDLSPRSEEVQALIHKHFQMIERFYNASKDVYIGLAQLYCEHPDFRKYYEAYHPKMAEFIAEAMRVYAHKNLV